MLWLAPVVEDSMLSREVRLNEACGNVVEGSSRSTREGLIGSNLVVAGVVST